LKEIESAVEELAAIETRNTNVPVDFQFPMELVYLSFLRKQFFQD